MLLHTLANMAQRSALWSSLGHKIPWPYRHYLFLEQRNLLYCPIPKVASGNLKRWFLLESNIPEQRWHKHPHDGIHTYVHGLFALKNKKLLRDNATFKVVFMRNPLTRIVSAFLDKFVRPFTPSNPSPHTSPALPLLFAIQKLRGYRRLDEATFFDFVSMVATLPNAMLDAHWLPQICFLGDVDFDFVGKTENLASDFQKVRKQIGAQTPLITLKKRQSYAEARKNVGYVGTAPIFELAKRESFPKPASFFDHKTLELVIFRYRMDFRAFNYSTDINDIE